VSHDLSLQGVFTPITTPFDENEQIAHGKLCENLELWNRTELAGYVVLGSNGEWVFLDESERMDVLRTAREAIPPDKLMIAGTASESTAKTIELTERAAALGADAAIVVNPSYYKSQMTLPVLADFYTGVAERAAVPILIYNLPPATGMDLSADLLVQLSHHPNIVGVKDTGGNVTKMADVVRRADPSFHVMAGSANFLYPSLAFGASGGVLALANIAPRESVALRRLFLEGKLDEGKALHLRMLPINLAITSRFGIGGLKAALDLLGYYGGPPRRPLRPLGQEKRRELEDILRRGGLLA